AAEFRLPATDGKTYKLDDVAGEKGTVVVFICNHCPYVKAVIDRMVADARVLMSEGVGFAAICSNDAASYPEDSFENMKRFAKAHDFLFPYLHDETQTVGKKRHILVDTLGLLLHVIVHPADIQDRDGGVLVMATLFGMFPFLKTLFADS